MSSRAIFVWCLAAGTMLLSRCQSGGEDPVSLSPNIETVAAASDAASPYDSYSLYWGDVHCHTAYSMDAIPGANPPAQALAYARDVAGLDFVAITDHAERYDAAFWDDLQVQCAAYNENDRFVAFIGFEYSKSSSTSSRWRRRSSSGGGGHKNVFFASADVIDVPFASSRRNSATDLWNALDPYQAITVPHHPAAPSPATTDWNVVNARFMPVVEIYSKHGNSEARGCEEPVDDLDANTTVEAALQRWLSTGDPAYKLGIIASTDDHHGKPGNVEELEENAIYSLPTTGGLAAVYAPRKTRQAIFSAMTDKLTYGTSGARIGLYFAVSVGGATAPMGGTLSCSPGSSISFDVSATPDNAPIDRIVLIKNGDIIATGNGATLSTNDTVSENAYYRVRVYQEPTRRWDGQMVSERAWSSPVWIECP